MLGVISADPGQGVHGVFPQKPGAAGGNHNRIQHHRACAVLPQFVRDDADHRHLGDHSDLDGVRPDVGEDGVQLGGDKVRIHIKNAGNAGGVLSGKGGDHAHAVDAQSGHSL